MPQLTKCHATASNRTVRGGGGVGLLQTVTEGGLDLPATELLLKLGAANFFNAW